MPPRCRICLYHPEKDSDQIRAFIENHGYSREFQTVCFGPEKEGKVLVCPVCGSVVDRTEPDKDYFMFKPDFTLSEIVESFDSTENQPGPLTSKKPLHKREAEQEPRNCEVCGKLVQPSDGFILVEYEPPTIVCSADCHEEFSTEFYND